MKIALGSDHVGYALKVRLMEYLTKNGHTPVDYGTHDTQRTHYPLYALRAAQEVARGECALGVLVCGTGIGISIAANKVRGIRAAVCSDLYSARMARAHNDANMLALGAMVVGDGLAQIMLDAFLEAEYEGGRHQQRVEMIAQIEQGGTL